jgi:hypothetical protein
MLSVFCEMLMLQIWCYRQISLAVRSKAWVCGRSDGENLGSNPAGGIDITSCEFCVLSGRDLSDEQITRPEESYRL